MQLKQGTLLQGDKYRIERVLGQGGFGITYLAENTMLDGKMAIKEFFFKEYCDREESTGYVTIPTSGNREMVDRFMQKFIKEARTIFRLNHPNIVGIHDIFKENGTAYYVMDYIEGESLGDMVNRRGAIPEAEAVSYIKEVAGALAYIHSKSINHLDIKPGNVMLRHEDHRLLLIDFGVSKQYDAETFEGTTTTPVGISHGYSPTEQYRRNGVQSFSPQSDVYALAATLYKLLTGVTPPEAIEVQDEGLPLDSLTSKHVSNATIEAIVKAMKSRTQRTQSVEAFIADLNEPVEATVVAESVPKEEPNPATGTENGHEWVDLGLSVKWATKNVGATSPGDYGDYYAWGETSAKSNYDWISCFDCLDGTGDSWRTYKLDGRTEITPTSGHDTARENWGGTWRMPTDVELEELCKKCKWTWTYKGAHKGYTVTGPNGNSIFLPAAGYRNAGGGTYFEGSYGIYRSSTLSSSFSQNARYLYFNSAIHDVFSSSRSNGQSVRPVTD